MNNVRDEPTDARVGKRTLVVRFGRRFGVAEYGCLCALAYAVPISLAALRWTSPWVLLSLATLPRALRLTRIVATRTGAALNPSLGDTAKLLFMFGALLSLGIAR